jgi:phospholipase C
VSWVVPGDGVSEHPQSSRGVAAGMAHVTRLVNSVMRGPDWDSSAIFITWDDWGGFYDHVVPPLADENGYGLRVPGLLVSPYARRGFVDHQTLTFDAYLKLIEDRFLDGQRLDPSTDGRPDSRPVVREALPILGDLALAFDFDRRPRAPLILDPTPQGDACSVNACDSRPNRGRDPRCYSHASGPELLAQATLGYCRRFDFVRR